jgi:hypothetical protein
VVQFIRGQFREIAGELGDTPPTPVIQQAFSFGRWAYPDDARVVRVPFAFDEAVALQSENEAGHRGCGHLLGAGQLTDRHWTTEHND